MEVFLTDEFIKRYRHLPSSIRKKAEKQETLFRQNPFHPSLHTEKLEPKGKQVWSFRIDRSYRILFKFVEGGDVCLSNCWASRLDLQNLFLGKYEVRAWVPRDLFGRASRFASAEISATGPASGPAAASDLFAGECHSRAALIPCADSATVGAYRRIFVALSFSDQC